MGADSPKKVKVIQSAEKDLVKVFWNSKGMLLIEYMKKGETINTMSYSRTLLNFWEAIKGKRRENLTVSFLLFHDNDMVQTAFRKLL